MNLEHLGCVGSAVREKVKPAVCFVSGRWKQRPVVMVSDGRWGGCSSCTEQAETRKRRSDVCNLGSHLNWWLRGQGFYSPPVSPFSQLLSHSSICLSRGRLPRGSQLKWIKYSVLLSKFYIRRHGQGVSGCSQRLSWLLTFREMRERQYICHQMRLWKGVVGRVLSLLRIL